MTPVLHVLRADARALSLASGSVHAAVTSPLYWGQRDYGTGRWEGGDPDHDHVPSRELHRRGASKNLGLNVRMGRAPGALKHERAMVPVTVMGTCACGATRIDPQLGLEESADEYVENVAAAMREVHRVLRADGTLWLNLGDAYVSAPKGRSNGQGASGLTSTRTQESSPPFEKRAKYRHGSAHASFRRDKKGGVTHRHGTAGLAPKNLLGLPWRVAFRMQEDGWILRADNVWAKPNPMPESVQDRPTRSHEFVFLFAKSERYYYDTFAIRETGRDWSGHDHTNLWILDGNETDGHRGFDNLDFSVRGRNKRDVWTIPTEPYAGAHFAPFPTELAKIAILAGSSAHGVCAECGAPWERQCDDAKVPRADRTTVRDKSYDVAYITTGWEKGCAHDAARRPAVVLDPFAGTGTVGAVALAHGRSAVLSDVSKVYLAEDVAARTSALQLEIGE